jgi:hypothetical protein
MLKPCLQHVPCKGNIGPTNVPKCRLPTKIERVGSYCVTPAPLVLAPLAPWPPPSSSMSDPAAADVLFSGARRLLVAQSISRWFPLNCTWGKLFRINMSGRVCSDSASCPCNLCPDQTTLVLMFTALVVMFATPSSGHLSDHISLPPQELLCCCHKPIAAC